MARKKSGKIGEGKGRGFLFVVRTDGGKEILISIPRVTERRRAHEKIHKMGYLPNDIVEWCKTGGRCCRPEHPMLQAAVAL